MNPSTTLAHLASNLQELIRLARVALTDEEFAEFVARFIKQHQRKEVA